MTLQELLRVPYVDGGRDPAHGLDCWGMVRAIRHHVLGLALLPTLDALQPGQLRKIDRASSALPGLHGFEVATLPKHGAIAAAWQGSLCIHVGIVLLIDGALRVVDTDKGVGARICPVGSFEARFTRVAYYEKCEDLPGSD